MERAYLNDKILLKVGAILSFFSITAALILIQQNSPATGYEISIYAALPKTIWILLLLANFFGVSIIVHQSVMGPKGNSWILGFLILIFVNFIILSLQVFRGYYIHSISDTLAHFDFTSSIISRGDIGELNFYPITHIITAVLVLISNISLETIMKYLPVFFTLSYILFTYLIATIVYPNKGPAILTAAGGTVFLFSYYHLTPYPHALALLFFPTFFYLYFRSFNTPSVSYKVLLIILLFVFPFFHPLPEIVLISTLVMGEAARLFLKRMNFQVKKFSGNLSLISFIPFFLWISYFSFFGSTVQRMIQWTKGEAAIVARANELAPVFGLGPWDFLKLLLKMYGHNLVFFIFSVISLWMIAAYFFQRRSEVKNLFIISVFMITGGVIFFIVSNGIAIVTWGRMLGANAGLWAAPIVASFSLYEISKKVRVKMVGIIIVVFILFTASVIGIFTIYRSPWISQPSWQVTHMDMRGSAWYNSHRASGYGYAPMGWINYAGYFKVPKHFGYPEFGSLGHVMNKETYIILTERFKQASVEPALRDWMNIPDSFAKPGFDEDDFKRFEQDQSINRIYTNKEFEVLIVRPGS